MSRHPEHLLISALLNTKNVWKAEELGITPQHIHEYKAEYEWITEYRLKYKQEPSIPAFLSVFPKFEVTGHTDVEYAAEEVSRHHLTWSMAKIAREVSNFVRSGEPEEALDYMAKNVLLMKSGLDTSQVLTNSITDYSETLDWAMSREASEKVIGAPFAHPTIQSKTLGMQNGDLWLKAARLGQGKTWDLINDSAESLIQGKKVLFFSLEMNRRSIEYRFQTILAKRYGYGVTNDMLAKGRHLDLIEYKSMLADFADKVTGDLYIFDRSRGKVTSRNIAAAVHQYDPDLVVIDYLSLMSNSVKNNYTQSWESVAQVVEEVKEIAVQFDVPILSAAQINRDGERGSWRPPKAVNLAGSDSLGRDADCVVTMKRFGQGAMVYSLEKNRHGQSGDIWFSRFDANNGDFHEITRQEAEAIKAREGEFDDDV